MRPQAALHRMPSGTRLVLQHLVDGGEQLARGEGLLNQGNIARKTDGGVAAHQHSRNRRGMASNLTNQFGSAHSRHGYVRQNQINSKSMGSHFESLARRAGWKHLEPVPGKYSFGDP